ncbi:MAG TPA: response regulator [Phycisphaerae bacterium]|nr:response regulator [Phycisphaerae bacterium]HOI56189.1 response regulator [Phycisphaerae bacterium]
MKVLLVDDSKVMRQIQRRSLEGFGFTDIVEAGDGVEGLQQMAGSPKPDIVILDWNMPRLDGLSTLRKIRETDKKTIVIMCTTEAEKPRVVEAVKAGVTNYIVKPFTPSVLQEKLDETLTRMGLSMPTAQ